VVPIEEVADSGWIIGDNVPTVTTCTKQNLT